VRPLGHTRLQITPTRYRIPDLMVLRNTDPKDNIIALAPLLCVEILSHEDRLNEIRQRVAEYVSVGAKAVWVIDPWRRFAYEETAEGLKELSGGFLSVARNTDRSFARGSLLPLDES
jgi:Uma2 family endonuclease